MADETSSKSLLFVCIENSSRSVMAEGFARRLGLNASSAGTVPSTHVNSLVVEVMDEVGIDVSNSSPRELTGEMIDKADLVVLTDASAEKSIPRDLRKKMKKKVVEWFLPDPQGKDIEEIRYVRDQVQKMVGKLATSNSD